MWVMAGTAPCRWMRLPQKPRTGARKRLLTRAPRRKLRTGSAWGAPLMQRPIQVVSLVLAAVLAARSAGAQATGPVTYSLAAPPSEFAWGCFGPCACPLVVQSEVIGTFVLTRSRVDPLFTYYDVTDVRWKMRSGSNTVTLTGAGTYKRGGEVALQEELALDLSVDGGAPLHFDSGLRSPGATFPEIRTQVTRHGDACFDTVITVDARPEGTLAVGGDPRLSLAVGPNPTWGMTEIAFTLPASVTVDLGVFDLAGRHVRTLVAHETLAAGAHAVRWDGRGEEGEEVPAGLYLVQLATPSSHRTRTAVRMR